MAVIAKRSRLTAAEVKFLRKYLGWSGADFARHMGVAPESTGRRPELVRLRQRAQDQAELLSDEAIAAACAIADPGAVAALFDRFHARVGRFLRRVVRSPVDAEDLLQETFLQVARGQARFDGHSPGMA
jgi:hypothetical protein